MPTDILAPPSSVRSADRALEAFGDLLAVLTESQFRGWDPYDALSSPLLSRLGRTPLLRRAAIQTLKRSRHNLRGWLCVPQQRHVKGLALAASACTTMAESGLGEHSEAELAVALADDLVHRRISTRSGCGWGYGFDVQTRWGYYRAGEPNAVVTAFAGHALLDVAELTGEARFREAADQAVSYCMRNLVVDGSTERFFAYYAGGRTAIHNANLLVAGLVARAQVEDAMPIAADAFAFTERRQRDDGSWPYGERTDLEWVDGYHTAYVLNDLRRWYEATGSESSRARLEKGLDYYLYRLIDADGAARASPDSRYPIDVHACSTAVTVLSRLRTIDDRALPAAERVLNWTLDHLRVTDGRFAYQQHHLSRNEVPYVRWSDCHMLLALANYAEATAGGQG
jgi:polysaccharide biosynthesis protein VpsJ